MVQGNRAALEEAKKNGKEKDFKFDKPSPGAAVLAPLPGDRREEPRGPGGDRRPQDDASRPATAPSPAPRSETRAKAIKILQDYYVDQAVDQGLSQHADLL